MALYQFPLMTVIQEICAKIGLVTGGGLATVIKRKYSTRIVVPISSLLIANTVNIGADIGAMGAAIKLIFPTLPFARATIAFTTVIILAVILVPYNRYARILKYLTLPFCLRYYCAYWRR